MRTCVVLAAAVVLCLAVTSSQAGVVAVMNPGDMITTSRGTGTYTSLTSLCNIAGITFGTTVMSVACPDGAGTDADKTVMFSGGMQRLGPVPTGWATWSSPPFSETANPPVLYTGGATSRTFTPTGPGLEVLGFELEPNPFAVFTYTATFTGTGGMVTRAADGAAGARLFAAVAGAGESISSVTVSGGADFAIAQLRIAQPAGPPPTGVIPEPGSCSLLSLGLLAAAGYGFYRRRAK